MKMKLLKSDKRILKSLAVDSEHRRIEVDESTYDEFDVLGQKWIIVEIPHIHSSYITRIKTIGGRIPYRQLNRLVRNKVIEHVNYKGFDGTVAFKLTAKGSREAKDSKNV